MKFALVKFALVKFALVGVIFTQNYARAHRALPPQKKTFARDMRRRRRWRRRTRRRGERQEAMNNETEPPGWYKKRFSYGNSQEILISNKKYSAKTNCSKLEIMSSGSYNSSNLDERYSFIKQAGQGTYGTTWIAEDKVLGKLVAVKAISKANTKRADFKRELKYGRYLSNHPNIITTYENAYETKSSYVMVQEFATGGDLFDAIKPEEGMKESKAKLYIHQIAKAVEYMHSKKLVHRDIKPENIVLGDKEGSYAQLIDFGMTLRTGTHVPKVCGSIPYTPPEICSSSDEVGFYADPSCDVWSVGVLLFCMLTGSFPWEQATLSDPNYYEFVQWQSGVISKPPPMWRKFSPQLLKLFNGLLAMDPRERYEITEIEKFLGEPWLLQSCFATPNIYDSCTLSASTHSQFSQLHEIHLSGM